MIKCVVSQNRSRTLICQVRREILKPRLEEAQALAELEKAFTLDSYAMSALCEVYGGRSIQ